ncbi:redoxin family protein [Pirellulaceae bacterium SH449]
MNFRIRPTLIASLLSCSFGLIGGLLASSSVLGDDYVSQVAKASRGRIGHSVEHRNLTDFQGKVWNTSDFQLSKGVVFAFLGAECPLAKLYSLRLVELANIYESRGVRFVAVNSNVQDSLAEMAAHAKKFGMTMPFLKDPDQGWADELGATRTPEVCVLDESGTLRYRGRIDDQYGIGYAKEKVNETYLIDALESILAGKEIGAPIVSAPGCLIGRGRRSGGEGIAEGELVTYSKQVSRILQQRCVSCHREDEIGPMDLSNYEDASAWADMILEVVNEGRMPPWHASPEYGHFANDRRMTQDEIDTLNQWVSQGLARGVASEDPEPLPVVQGWQLPREPDLVVEMAKRPFKVPPTGDVRYQYFQVDLGLEKDIWVNGMEIVPGNRAVVHHILVFVRDKDDKSQNIQAERGFLSGYVPGARMEFMPEGMAKRIPAGSQLVFQLHYTPIGTEQLDLSKIGFWYADPATITHEVQTTSAVQTAFRIPPRADNYRTSAMLPEALPESLLLSMSPHMHLRGKSFRYTAVLPSGDREILLDIPNYDFNWQTEYRLAEPRLMPAGSRIFCEAAFDNSEKNLNNPDPNATVTWGDQTYQEMMIGYFHIAVPIDPDTGKAATLTKQRSGQPSAREIFNLLDLDGDGRVLRDQVPPNLRRVFDRLDQNKDGVLELSELPPTL